MHRMAYVVRHRPGAIAQAHRHRRRPPAQRRVAPHPVVQVPPQPHRGLQSPHLPRGASRPPRQPRLLAADRRVEPLQVRRVHRRADPQLGDPRPDRLEPAEQGLRLDLDEAALCIADLLYHPDEQARGRLEPGGLLPPEPPLAAAMEDLPEDLQQRRRVGPVVVDEHQRRGGARRAAQGYRGDQRRGGGQVARADPQVDHEPADDRQGGVDPDPARAATASRGPAAPPFFAGSSPPARPCHSSSWTASTGAASRSSCRRWKSSPRRPAASSNRATVWGSTSQMSAVASSEQPYPRHLTMRTTVGSGSWVYRNRVPCRSVNRCLHIEQYRRRMCLPLPIPSTTLRLPASKRLNSEQSGLGQAQAASEPAGSRSWGVVEDLRPMAGLRALDEIRSSSGRSTPVASLRLQPVSSRLTLSVV